MKYIDIARDGPVFEVTLNHPKVNAINTLCSRELDQAFCQFRDDPSLRVAIITGAGDRFFSAGWDLKAEESVNADHGPGGFAGLTERFDLNKPVIGAVNGMAVGGGLELALACDLVIAADHAAFLFAEVTIGMMPDAGGILRLPKRIPRAIALEMIYTGSPLTAERAYHYGLINRVVSGSELMQETRKIADKIVKAAPLAIAAAKEMLRHTEQESVEAGYQIMRSGKLPAYQKMLQSDDVLEGQQAFVEKREPVWTGK